MPRLVIALLELSGSLSDAVGDLLVGIAYRAMELRCVLSVFDPAQVAHDGDLESGFRSLLDVMQVRLQHGDKDQVLVVDTKNDVSIFATLARVCYTHPSVLVVVGANSDELFKAWSDVDASMCQLTVQQTSKPHKPFLISPLSTGILVASEQERRLNDVISCRLTVPVDKWVLHMKQFTDTLTGPDLDALLPICMLTPTTAAGESFRAATIALFQASNQLGRLRFVLYDPESIVSMLEASRQAFVEGAELLYWMCGGFEIFEYVLTSRPPVDVRETQILVQGFMYSEIAVEYTARNPEYVNYFMAYMGVVDNNNTSLTKTQDQLLSWQAIGTPAAFMGNDAFELALLYSGAVRDRLTDPTLGVQLNNVAREVLDQYGGLMGVTTVDNYLDRTSGYTIIGAYVNITQPTSPIFLQPQWSELDIQSISADGAVRYMYPTAMFLDVGLRPSVVPSPPPDVTFVVTERLGNDYVLSITDLIGSTGVQRVHIPTDEEIARNARTFKSFSLTTCTFSVAPEELTFQRGSTLVGSESRPSAGPSPENTPATLPAFTNPAAFVENVLPDFSKSNVVRVNIVFPRFAANTQALAWEYAYVTDAFTFSILPARRRVTLLVSYEDAYAFYGGSAQDLVQLCERLFADVRAQYRNALEFQLIFDSESCFVFMASPLFQELARANTLRAVFVNAPSEWPPAGRPPPPLPTGQAYMDRLVLQFYSTASQMDRVSLGTNGNYATPTMRIAAAVSYAESVVARTGISTKPSSSSAISQIIRTRQLVDAGANKPSARHPADVPLGMSMFDWIFDTIVIKNTSSGSTAFITLDFTPQTLAWDEVVYADVCWGSLNAFLSTSPPTPSEFAFVFNEPYESSFVRFGFVVRAYVRNSASIDGIDLSPEKVPDPLNAEFGTTSAPDCTRIFFPPDNTLVLADSFVTPRAIESTQLLQGSVAEKVVLQPNVPFSIESLVTRRAPGRPRDHTASTQSAQTQRTTLSRLTPLDSVLPEITRRRLRVCTAPRSTRSVIHATVNVPAQRVLAVIVQT